DSCVERLRAPGIEISLQDYGSGPGIDAVLPLPLRLPETDGAHGPFRDDRGEALVHEVDGDPAAGMEPLRECAHLARPVAIVAGQGEGKADDDRGHLVFRTKIEQRLYGRTLAS